MRTAEGILADFLIEYRAARAKHETMHSAHEGWAVLKEEVDELWDVVKTKEQDPVAMRKEAIQVGAMALAFIHEICNPKLTLEALPIVCGTCKHYKRGAKVCAAGVLCSGDDDDSCGLGTKGRWEAR